MDGKRTKSVFLSINLLSFILSLSISSSIQTQTQTLFITPLSKPKSLTRTDSETQTQTIYTNQKANQLSFDLHHVDTHPSLSTLSPKSLFDLLLKRDRLRVSALSANKHIHGVNSSVFSGLWQGIGEFFTRIGVGTPPKPMDLILDTGSDIIWMQCHPCKNCYTQSDPIYAPNKSRSSRQVLCGSKKCHADTPCPKNSTKKCEYKVLYGDGSFTRGDIMTETLTFRGNKLNDILFGCGHDNEGLFVGAAGLLGLSRGKLSFPAQLGKELKNAFSYCLVGRTSNGTSSILFGDKALSRKGVYTPLLTNPNPSLDTFYYVAFEGISVGGDRVHIPQGVLTMDATGGGGAIIDSGTSVTRLPPKAYEALRDAFRNMTKDLRRTSGLSILDTCYDLSGLTSVEVPTVELHFRGVNMVLPAENYIIPVEDDDAGKYCFAFASMTGGLSIIGNIQQQGFRISFDLANNRIGFTPNSCGSD